MDVKKIVNYIWLIVFIFVVKTFRPLRSPAVIMCMSIDVTYKCGLSGNMSNDLDERSLDKGSRTRTV